MIELKKCPHCGGKAKFFIFINRVSTKDKDKGIQYAVKCEDCVCGTPVCDSALEAAELWNGRDNDINDMEDIEEESVRKIYVSLPINGLDENDKYAIQKAICEDVCDYLGETVELCEPIPEDDSSELEILSARLEAMKEAEYVVFTEGWELNRECRIEYATAKEYDKKILTKQHKKIQEEI